MEQTGEMNNKNKRGPRTEPLDTSVVQGRLRMWIDQAE